MPVRTLAPKRSGLRGPTSGNECEEDTGPKGIEILLSSRVASFGFVVKLALGQCVVGHLVEGFH